MMDVAAAEMIMKGMAALASAIAVLGGLGPGVSEGLCAAKAVEGVSRNPDAYSKIRTTMVLGCALTETTGIYGLLIALLLLFLVAM